MKHLLSVISICAIVLPLTGQTDNDKPAPPDYVLAANDQIVLRSIPVKEIGDKPFRLDEQGEINLPMVGRVKASGFTARQLESELNKKYENFYVEPQMSVTVAEYRGSPVSIIGAVGNPGVQQVRGKPLLLEVLSSAGGVRPDAGPIIKITRQKKYGLIPLEGAHATDGDATVAEVGVQSLIDARSTTDNIVIQPFDVISVPRADLIYVVGNVRKAGSINLSGRRSLSVLEALAMAEGFEPRASSRHSRILRAPVVGKPVDPRQQLVGGRVEIPIDLINVLDGKAEDIHLQPNDILYVPNSTAKTVSARSLEAALQIGTGLLIWRR